MNILLGLVFISVILVLASILLFGIALKNRDFDHADETSLLPLEDDKDAEP